ncbi:hypothetical protein FOCC_FOCC001115 [Frankliniella occidentalis]|nr:hypothetical protein FOCC_FOCC001115 [Frankliniella occidentalis]
MPDDPGPDLAGRGVVRDQLLPVGAASKSQFAPTHATGNQPTPTRVLRRVRRAGAAHDGQRLHVLVRDGGRADRVRHRLEHGAGVPDRHGGLRLRPFRLPGLARQRRHLGRAAQRAGQRHRHGKLSSTARSGSSPKPSVLSVLQTARACASADGHARERHVQLGAGRGRGRPTHPAGGACRDDVHRHAARLHPGLHVCPHPPVPAPLHQPHRPAARVAADAHQGLAHQGHGSQRPDQPPDIVAFVITLLMTLLMAAGVKKSLVFNNVLNAVNLAVWVFVMTAGLFYVDSRNWSEHKGFLPYGWSGVLTGAATCFYAFIGFDIIATTGEESNNPKKSIPLAIVGSLAIILVAYVTSSLMLTLVVPYDQVDKDSALVEMWSYVGANKCKYVVAVGALAGLSVSMFGSMFPMPRIVYAMAQDGLIFK